MRHLLIIGLLLAALVSAHARGFMMGVGSGASGGGGGCTNSLDFTQACNSQYIGAIL